MLSDVPATAQFAAMGMGLSNQMSGATPLPFDIGALGAPSCFLHNDMSLGAFTLGGSAAQVQFSTALPPQTAFVGLPLFQQGWCYDPTANGDLIAGGSFTRTGRPVPRPGSLERHIVVGDRRGHARLSKIESEKPDVNRRSVWNRRY